MPSGPPYLQQRHNKVIPGRSSEQGSALPALRPLQLPQWQAQAMGSSPQLTGKTTCANWQSRSVEPPQSDLEPHLPPCNSSRRAAR